MRRIASTLPLVCLAFSPITASTQQLAITPILHSPQTCGALHRGDRLTLELQPRYADFGSLYGAHTVSFRVVKPSLGFARGLVARAQVEPLRLNNLNVLELRLAWRSACRLGGGCVPLQGSLQGGAFSKAFILPGNVVGVRLPSSTHKLRAKPWIIKAAVLAGTFFLFSKQSQGENHSNARGIFTTLLIAGLILPIGTQHQTTTLRLRFPPGMRWRLEVARSVPVPCP